MGTEQNLRTVHRCFEEICNRGDFRSVEQIFAANFVGYEPTGKRDLARWIRVAQGLRRLMPDLRYTIEAAVASEDQVAVQWNASGTHSVDNLGLPATRKRLTMSGMSFFRLQEGRIVGQWSQKDRLGLLQQLGVIDANLAGIDL